MKTQLKNIKIAGNSLLIAIIGLILFNSCSKDDFVDASLSGSWIIEKAELTTYENGKIIDTKTYSDSCGFILLFDGTPGHVYAVINYPSNYLQTDLEGNWDTYNWEDGYFTLTLNFRDLNIPIEDYKSRTQTWTFGEKVNGIYETVYLKRG
jgi:hypothetical protein